MPIPTSKRGQLVTSAAFEQPFDFRTTRFGMKGINLMDAIDAIEPDELTRMLNLTHRQEGGLTSRVGQTTVMSGLGTNVHSMRRLNRPADYESVLGVDTNLWVGQENGPTALVDTGYSGSPLSFVPYHPPTSGESWMYVADTLRMRKVRSDGVDLPIGLPAPSVAASIALGTENKTVIADFDTDGTAQANWDSPSPPGYTFDDPPVALADTEVTQTAFGTGQGDGTDQQSMAFTVNPTTTSPTGYYAIWGVQKPMNLNLVGSLPATDDDFIHVYLNFSDTEKIKEFRIYFVCSAIFANDRLPGTAGSGISGTNSDAYLKSFTANDFADYIQGKQTQLEAAEVARVRAVREISLEDRKIETPRPDTDPTIQVVAAQDPARLIALQVNPAADQWQKFGVIGLPLRRGDFQRIGNVPGRDWSTITGLIFYLSTEGSPGHEVGAAEVRVSHMYMTGGYGPDSAAAQSTPYDYRYTHIDIRTGSGASPPDGPEGNPSPIMSTANYLDSLRRSIQATPAAYGDVNIRQRFYRRGGTLPTDWFYAGVNSSDGGVFIDTISDTDAAAANTLEIDNDQPISTVSATGATLLNQPLSSLWGPLQDLLMGCGDVYRPGNVYFCKPGQPDSWPPENRVEVCSPSEQLMMGCLYGGQAFVFSAERLFILYPNLTGDATSVTSTSSQCQKGLINRWALAVGIGGMYFVSRDGIYRTVGGPEEWISRKIDPLFRGKTINGYLPIDFTAIESIRLTIHENELYFQYRDSGGTNRVLVLNLLYNFWRLYSFGNQTSSIYSDEGNLVSSMFMGGRSSGKVYRFSGTSDDGVAISCQARTGSIDFGRPREEKRMGDMAMSLNNAGVDIAVQNYINMETVTNPAQTIPGSSGIAQVVLDSFGTVPQIVTNIASDISWSSSTAAPVLYWLGGSIIIEPEITVNRVTQWDDMNHPDESYLMGVTFDCDTKNIARSIIAEYDFNGIVNVAATLTVTSDGRHKFKFSWPAVQANKVRIRPNDDCKAWILYKADWITQAEPPRIAIWDSYFENGWDNYYTGVDIYGDTSNLPKTILVYVDNSLIKTETVTLNGRGVWHITLPAGRGHVFHLIATDANPGLLYDLRWQIVPEPSEQTNWNQNYTIEGTEADKYLKALVFQCDTFGQNKTVTVEADGVVVETFTVNTNGRKVVMQAFPEHLGRVFRIYPTDNFNSRLYSVNWIFDQEPLALTRWETQEITHNIAAWHYPIYGHVTLKSTGVVTLVITAYNQSGIATSKTYNISSTANTKQKRFVPFEAMKGVMFKYLFTAADPFWLYKEETSVAVRVWGSEETSNVRPFGNDDLDQTRAMTRASLAAARSGGAEGAF